MPIYCICCELTDGPTAPTPDGGTTHVRDILPGVSDEVAAVGPSIQLSRTTWLVAADCSAAELMERFWPQVLAAEERVVVFRLASAADWRCHSGSADPVVCDWLAEHLGTEPDGVLSRGDF